MRPAVIIAAAVLMTLGSSSVARAEYTQYRSGWVWVRDNKYCINHVYAIDSVYQEQYLLVHYDDNGNYLYSEVIGWGGYQDVWHVTNVAC
jgi:hypothetical protein